MIYLSLFYEFFKIGLFAIGGGLATLPFLSKLAAVTGWFTQAELADMIAISESTPGPIGINMATYAGFKAAGVLGAVTATLGEVLPSIIIVLIVARFLRSFSENKTVKAVFYGLRPASVGLITAAGYTVLKIALLNTKLFEESGNFLQLFRWESLLLGVAIYFIIKKWKPHPVVSIAISAAVGIVFGYLKLI